MRPARTRLFPYIVSPSTGGQPISRIGREIGVALFRAEDERIFYREDFDDLRADGVSALLAARDNLGAVFDAGQIACEEVDGAITSIVLRHPILGAACIVLPGLWEWAHHVLGKDRLLAALPTRDVLVLFADDGPALRAEVRTQLTEFDDALSTELFAIEACGVHEIEDDLEIPITCDATVAMAAEELASHMRLSREWTCTIKKPFCAGVMADTGT